MKKLYIANDMFIDKYIEHLESTSKINDVFIVGVFVNKSLNELHLSNDLVTIIFKMDDRIIPRNILKSSSWIKCIDNEDRFMEFSKQWKIVGMTRGLYNVNTTFILKTNMNLVSKYGYNISRSERLYDIGMVIFKGADKLMIEVMDDKNYIGLLNEYTNKDTARYKISSRNDKFQSVCNFMGKTTIGYGKNKKIAKKESAKLMCVKLEIS